MDYDYDETDPYVFANEGSALRVATDANPRNLPCPNCGAEDQLTREDVSLGYQCDVCDNDAEMGF